MGIHKMLQVPPRYGFPPARERQLRGNLCLSVFICVHLWQKKVLDVQSCIVSPPLTLSTWPVRYDARSLAKNRIASATSAGLAKRRNGIARISASRCFSGADISSGVSVGPGHMQLTFSL